MISRSPRDRGPSFSSPPSPAWGTSDSGCDFSKWLRGAVCVHGVAVSSVVDHANISAAARPVDVAAIHAAHGDFVWLSLQRLGVRDSDLQDMHQEVFVVVHQRLHTFDGSARMTTWLFGIAMRVAS